MDARSVFEIFEKISISTRHIVSTLDVTSGRRSGTLPISRLVSVRLSACSCPSRFDHALRCHYLHALALFCSPFARGGERTGSVRGKMHRQRGPERAAKNIQSDRVQWVKVLEAAFPGKVATAAKEEEYAAWFDLLADKNGEWRRKPAASPEIAGLFDRVIQRMELGPVPSIKTRRIQAVRPARSDARPARRDKRRDPNEDADRAFRVLDRDADGELNRDELSKRLRSKAEGGCRRERPHQQG